MWVVFIGGAMVTRRNTHIAVELLSNVMKPGRLRAALLALGRFRQARLHRPARLSVGDDHRAHGIQRMTVFDLPMSYVYAGVASGCLLMLVRQALNLAQCPRALAAGRRPPPSVRRTEGAICHGVFIFIAVLLAGVPSVHRAGAGLSCIYTHFSRRDSGLR
jgi:hypothetical protein